MSAAEIVLALLGMGVLGAAGFWIDLALDESETKAVRRHLDAWWVQFDNITWFNFGRREAQAAIVLFDRLFGARFWSRRRWTSVIILALGAVLLSCLWLMLAIGSSEGMPTVTFSHDRMGYLNLAVTPLVLALTLAVSLSLTRWLSTLVVSRPRALVLLGFPALLAVSIFLFVAWMPGVWILKATLPILLAGILYGGGSFDWFTELGLVVRAA